NRHRMPGQPKRLAVEPAQPIAKGRLALLARDRQSQAKIGQAVLAGVNQQPRITRRTAAVVNPAKVARPAQMLVRAEGERFSGLCRHGSRHAHGSPARGFCGLSRANSSINSRLRSSFGAGTTILISMNWSPPLMPLPRNRRRAPLDAPGGTLTVNLAPSSVGTSTLA